MNGWVTAGANNQYGRYPMKISKRFLFAATLVLVVGQCFGAMAQSKMNSKGGAFPSPQGFPPTASVDAIEVAAGTVVVDNEASQETTFGYTFLGQTSGDVTGSLTLSLNCMQVIPGPGDIVGPGTKIGAAEVTGGAWTLPVYTLGVKGSGGHTGSLYGTIAKGGTMTWDKSGTNAIVYFELNVDGGTQSWSGIQGSATFVGVLAVDAETQKSTLRGDLVFSMMSIK
jgi:hypothetical protein